MENFVLAGKAKTIFQVIELAQIGATAAVPLSVEDDGADSALIHFQAMLNLVRIPINLCYSLCIQCSWVHM